MADLHQVEVAWLAQRVNHAITDHGSESLALFFIQRPLLLIFLLRGHFYSNLPGRMGRRNP